MQKLNKYYRFQITIGEEEKDKSKLSLKIHSAIGINKVNEHIRYIKKLNAAEKDETKKLVLIASKKFIKDELNIFYQYQKLGLIHIWGYVLTNTKIRASKAVEKYIVNLTDVDLMELQTKNKKHNG